MPPSLSGGGETEREREEERPRVCAFEEGRKPKSCVSIVVSPRYTCRSANRRMGVSVASKSQCVDDSFQDDLRVG